MRINKNGVQIRPELKKWGHCLVEGAQCCCGKDLMVSPTMMQDIDKPGRLWVSCEDFAHISFDFSDLVRGKQPEPENETNS